MSIHDTLQRFIFDKIPVRGEFVQLHESFQTIVNQHDYPPAVRKLLGEALCVATLLSAIIKFKGRLTVQFRGKGRLKLLLAQCNSQFQLRALVKWDGDLSYDDLMEAFNDGVLVIMLDGGLSKGQYQGIVSWRGNSLVESIEGYFKDSEQLATKIMLEVNDVTAVGYLLQVVPGTSTDSHVENEMILPHWAYVNKLTEKLLPVDLLNVDFVSLLKMLYPNEDIRLFDAVAVGFGCTCSRERGAEAILILGKEEAEKELKDKQSIVVTCDFCNEEYIFDRVDVAKIFEDKRPPGSDIQIH